MRHMMTSSIPPNLTETPADYLASENADSEVIVQL